MPSQPVSDLEFLQDLIDTPEPPKGTRTRKPKDVRDVDTWFKLDHINNRCHSCGGINCVEKGYEGADDTSSFPSKCLTCGSEDVSDTGHCSQGENCIGLVIYNKGPERVTSIVNDVEMCRFDFLDGLAYTGND
jgi:hypothetical protein